MSNGTCSFTQVIKSLNTSDSGRYIINSYVTQTQLIRIKAHRILPRFCFILSKTNLCFQTSSEAAAVGGSSPDLSAPPTHRPRPLGKRPQFIGPDEQLTRTHVHGPDRRPGRHENNKNLNTKGFVKQHAASPTNCTVPSRERKFEKRASSFFLQEFGRKRVQRETKTAERMTQKRICTVTFQRENLKSDRTKSCFTFQ